MNLGSMPIYEYYCAVCEGRFRHLAKRIDAPSPPCPRCGTTTVTRLISAANVIHSGKHHERQLRETSAQVDGADPRAMARFLQESGRLADAEGVYGSQAYRELLARRAEGATDADVTDLVDDLATEMRASDASQMAGAVALADRVENRMLAEGPPEHHDHLPSTDRGAVPPARNRTVKDLGWG
ncbi:MAG TPA: zinc ribbon domain-containing protein [Anaerolineae bacterium]|nr:zinc ribbon domain-containing protein [Anaerolineae bacterium]HQI85413.1 zinc ribbon domain-containing protein [Anaerolineae bacterium]